MGGALAGIGAGAVRTFSGDYLLAFMTSGLACLLASLLVLRIRGPRACDSACGLTGRERDLTFRGPGTEGSNPAPSTGESAANQTSSMRVPKRKPLGYLPHLFDAVIRRVQRGCAGLLDRAGAVRVARFVCSDSSAASASGGTSGSNAPTLSCCSEDPAGCAATRLGSYGANGLLPTEYGRGPVTEERGAFVPQKP